MNANVTSSKLRPELRKAIEVLPALPFHIKWLIPCTRVLFNLAAKSKLSGGVISKVQRHEGRRVVVWEPEGGANGAAVLWCFGGGHIAGQPEHLNALASAIVKATGASVFAPHYRLSPKHPFPADLDDCFACWQYLTTNASSQGIDLDRMAVGGNSAGGGLAAALSQRILDHGGPQPKSQILFYPMLDDRTAADHSKDALETYLWQNKSNRVAWSVYLSPNEPGAQSLPKYAAPGRREDLSGLPPAWVGYGDIDLFADEGRDYAARLTASGVECEELVITGAPHAFETIVPGAEVSRVFIGSAIAFLQESLGSNG